MAALTKEQKAAKAAAAARADALAAAGLTEEQLAALSEDEQVAIFAKNPAENIANEVELVSMKRDPEFYDAPHAADVHPHEVSSYALGGWEIA
jgi:hypothetical protein